MKFGQLLPRLLLATGAAIAFLPRLFSRLKTTQAGWINADELNTRITSGKVLTILDVRGGDEFTGPLGHIPGALNIPLDDISKRLSEIKARTNSPVILVCRTDKRSSQAARFLKEADFQDIHVLRGGMEQWNQAGFQVSSKSAPARTAELRPRGRTAER